MISVTLYFKIASADSIKGTTGIAYVSDIEEGAEPENLLLFTKMQEMEAEKASNTNETQENNEKDSELIQAIDSEIKRLND